MSFSTPHKGFFYVFSFVESVFRNWNRVSANTTATKINTQPIPILSVSFSCKNSVLNKTPNTDSKLKNKDASED